MSLQDEFSRPSSTVNLANKNEGEEEEIFVLRKKTALPSQSKTDLNDTLLSREEREKSAAISQSSVQTPISHNDNDEARATKKHFFSAYEIRVNLNYYIPQTNEKKRATHENPQSVRKMPAK